MVEWRRQCISFVGGRRGQVRQGAVDRFPVEIDVWILNRIKGLSRVHSINLLKSVR